MPALLTKTELLVISLARYVEEKTLGFVGTGSLLGIAACMLAENLYTPDITWLAGETGFINPAPPLVKSLSGYTPRTEATKSLNAVLRYLSRGFDFFIAEVGQIDKIGRINRQTSPEGKCTAGTGSSSFMSKAKKLLLFSLEHSQRVFVEKVPFVTVRSNINRPDHKVYVFTPEGIISWHTNPDNKNEILPFLIAVYDHSRPIEEIQENTGFDLRVSDDLKLIQPPDEEELDAIKTIDPFGYLNDK